MVGFFVDEAMFVNGPESAFEPVIGRAEQREPKRLIFMSNFCDTRSTHAYLGILCDIAVAPVA